MLVTALFSKLLEYEYKDDGLLWHLLLPKGIKASETYFSMRNQRGRIVNSNASVDSAENFYGF